MSEKLNTSLTSYITKSIGAGASETQIKRNLALVGWSEEQINNAYEQGLINRGVPSPIADKNIKTNLIDSKEDASKSRKSSAGETAMNLLSFGLLAIVATATGILFYQIINKFFPDALAITSSSYMNHFSTSSVHYTTAVLIVAFPVYYLVMYYWFKGFRKDLEKTETGLSKFLTYLVLLITAVTILGDLIATVYTFLQGELSIRFFLKTLIILIIAGLIFGFYYLERKKVQYKKNIKRDFFKVFGLTATALVVSGIVFGFFATGSPALERQRGFDNQRESDLADLANCVENYTGEYKKLPRNIEELEISSYSYCSSKQDPASGEDYEYKVKTISRQVGINTEVEFELCATFDLDSEESANPSKRYYSNNKEKWEKHTAGRSCTKSTVLIKENGNQEFIHN
jgi:hypothetical protein